MSGLFELTIVVGAIACLVALKAGVRLLPGGGADPAVVRSLDGILRGMKVLKRRRGSIEVEGIHGDRKVRIAAEAGYLRLTVEVTQGITFRQESALSPKDQRIGLPEFDDLVNLPGLTRESMLALRDADTRAALMRLCCAGAHCADGVARVALQRETQPLRDEIASLINDIHAVIHRFARVGPAHEELVHHAKHDADDRFRHECAAHLLACGKLDDALSLSLLTDASPAVRFIAASVRNDAAVMADLALEARGNVAAQALALLIRWDVFHSLDPSRFIAIMSQQEAAWRTLVRQNISLALDDGQVSLIEDHLGAVSTNPK